MYIKSTLHFCFALSFLAVFLICGGYLQAQTTKVSGKVVDIATREPLPFINVVFKGTTAGTTTDFDGNYVISTDKNSDSLVFTYIGYDQQAVKVKAGQTQQINVGLSASTVSLKEVVIKPGENPAHAILRKVIKNKPLNDREKLDYYQYQVYNKIEFDINNISDKFKKSTVVKPFKFVFDNIDSSNVAEKPFLPLFLSESLSELYYRKRPKVTKEIIKASKVAGIDNESVSQFTGDLYQNVNIYDNAVLVFGKNFTSPVSDAGLFFYRYYLIDSMFVDGKYCYQIQFKPKRKQSLCFVGNMWINDTTFAIKRLEMNMSGDANINYINTFNVVQDYQQVENSWFIKKDKLVVDFIIQKSKPGFYGRKTTSYANFVVNKPLEEKFYSKADNLIVEDDAGNKSADFWLQNRHDTLSKNEQGIYKMVDTIRTIKAFRTYQEIIESFTTGYRVMGYIELGPINKLLSYNNIEGPRLRFGGRTSNKFSKWHEFSAYTAYGFNDQKFKYGLGYRGFITKDPRQMIGFTYKNDYEILGQSQNGFSYDNFIATIFRIRPLTNLTNLQDYNAYYSYEWFPGFENKISFVNRVYTPVAGFKYTFRDVDQSIKELPRIITSEIRLSARLAIDEKYLAGEFDRMSLGTKWPVLSVQYNAGIKGVFGSNYKYHKINLNIVDRFRINPIGYTDYIIDAGKFFGNVPFPLMEIHGGNETYFYDPYAFNMMRFYEFVSDEYASLSVSHHFEGFFLNKIPIMRRLKWREVVSGKVLVGAVNKKSSEILIFPNALNTLNGKPYCEAGVGVENILKILRFDLLWRLSHLENPDISKIGFRGTLQFIF
jgi:hypothetical protein